MDAFDYGAALTRIARQDKGALETLFELESGRLIGVALRIVRRRDLAEEVVQEAFPIIWRKAARFSGGPGSARGWVYAILRNRALDAVRDMAQVELDADGGVERAEGLEISERAWRDLGQTSDLRRRLETLETEKRRSMLMAYVVGYTHGEIAGRLGAPLGTVKARIRRGLTALGECLS